MVSFKVFALASALVAGVAAAPVDQVEKRMSGQSTFFDAGESREA